MLSVPSSFQEPEYTCLTSSKHQRKLPSRYFFWSGLPSFSKGSSRPRGRSTPPAVHPCSHTCYLLPGRWSLFVTLLSCIQSFSPNKSSHTHFLISNAISHDVLCSVKLTDQLISWFLIQKPPVTHCIEALTIECYGKTNTVVLLQRKYISIEAW